MEKYKQLSKQLHKFYIYHEWAFKLPTLYGCIFLLSYLFFNSTWFSILLGFLSLLSFKYLRKSSNQHLLNRVEKEFKTFIYSLSSLISVGKSMEHALEESLVEIQHENNTFVMYDDLHYMVTCLKTNRSIDDSLTLLTKKFNIESIRNFSRIVEITLRQGGSMELVIERTVAMIDEKTKVENELDVIITQKKFELYILLSFVPLMIVYLRMVTKTFMPTMYGTLTGRMTMFVCLIVYLFSGYLGKRIVDIEV